MVNRLLRQGETLEQLRAAFMVRVTVDQHGCWLWDGKADRYGSFRDRPAHRASWELHQGRIPNGLLILHGCDLHDNALIAPQRGCVNPAHIRPGTPRENARDAERVAARVLGKPEESGEMVTFHARFNECEMAELRRLAKEEETSMQRLVRRIVREGMIERMRQRPELEELLRRLGVAIDDSLADQEPG
jgi:hypothetical protein